jgi:NTP pyrophosphatase (non-canonical NTP hydrolase)
MRLFLAEITDERQRQDAKWGAGRTLPNDVWYRILGEEVGEVAMALNDKEPVENLRAELVQVAATAVAWLECLDASAPEHAAVL